MHIQHPKAEPKETGQFLLIAVSDLDTVPVGACARVRSVGFSKLGAGDFLAISVESKTTACRFVRLSMTHGSTRLIVVDGGNQEHSIPSTWLLGMIVGVKLEGPSYNPNPRTFFQRAAFKMLHLVRRAQPAA